MTSRRRAGGTLVDTHNFRRMLQARRGDRMKRREFITPLESAARKTNATKQKQEVPKKDGPETPSDSPPNDHWDDALTKRIPSPKKRAYVTQDHVHP